MRTKTLLMAGAALAVSLATSQAQVYSANVVGYANVVVYGGGHYTLVANPFDDGNGNSATNWLDPNNTLPNKSSIQTWNGTGWSGEIKLSGSGWTGGDINTKPPTGFLVFLPATQTSNLTNTFVGTVIVNSGGSVTNTIPTGYTVWGSPIPYAGDLITSTNLGSIGNLLTVNKSQIQVWANGGSGYTGAILLSGTGWSGGPVNLSVGEGFLLFNKGVYSTNWVENATY